MEESKFLERSGDRIPSEVKIILGEPFSGGLFITEKGDSELYSSPDVIKPVDNATALESPVYEDIRGKIIRNNVEGFKYNTIETKSGFMRSGDLHKATQFDLIRSGKIELWTMVGDETRKDIITPNMLLILQPDLPHLFNFLDDTIMEEWWDGPFQAWFYKPYRDIIDAQFKKRVEEIKKEVS